MGKLICLFTGHTPIRHLTETDGYFSFLKCEQCGALLGMPKWKWKNIPPPDSTPEQVLQWEQFCEDKYQKIRDSFMNQQPAH